MLLPLMNASSERFKGIFEIIWGEIQPVNVKMSYDEVKELNGFNSILMQPVVETLVKFTFQVFDRIQIDELHKDVSAEKTSENFLDHSLDG
jgi:hypothetical protein